MLLSAQINRREKEYVDKIQERKYNQNLYERKINQKIYCLFCGYIIIEILRNKVYSRI